jgi:hypothetical protein
MCCLVGRWRKSPLSERQNFITSMRQTIIDLQASRIRDVANAGLGRSDVLAFWFGESDEVSPDFVRQAAIDSLNNGETFYAHNLGLPSLREAIASEMQSRHAANIGVERIAVTSGGVNALMLAMQAIVNPGDEVVVVTPVWPNLTAQPVILGAQLKTVCLEPNQGRWTLPMEEIAAGCHFPHQVAGGQFTQQPDRLDADPGGTTNPAGALPPHRHLDLADEVYENLFYLPIQQPLCSEFFGHRRARRPIGGGTQFFQKLFDDRLAFGLVGHAGIHDRAHGQVD